MNESGGLWAVGSGQVSADFTARSPKLWRRAYCEGKLKAHHVLS
jgi:hypothetical protein